MTVCIIIIKMIGGILKNALKGAGALTRLTGSAGVSAARESYGIGKLAMRYPKTAAAVAGTGAYLGLRSNSPYDSPSLEGVEMNSTVTSDARALQAMDSGIAPTGSYTSGARIRLQNSTDGLVQGLHRSRH